MNFNNNNKAIFMQIADKLCDEVMLGTINCGERIPSVREYASRLEVNANTVMRSYEYLERSGIIYNRRGIGFFISENARETITALRRESFFNDEIGYFLRQLMTLDISPDELKTIYSNYLNRQ